MNLLKPTAPSLPQETDLSFPSPQTRGLPAPLPRTWNLPPSVATSPAPRGTACRLFWCHLLVSTGFPGSLESTLCQIHSLLSLQISLRRQSLKAQPWSQSGKELDAEKKKPKIASSRSFHRAKVNTKECPHTLLCAWQVLQCAVVASRCC